MIVGGWSRRNGFALNYPWETQRRTPCRQRCYPATHYTTQNHLQDIAAVHLAVTPLPSHSQHHTGPDGISIRRGSTKQNWTRFQSATKHYRRPGNSDSLLGQGSHCGSRREPLKKTFSQKESKYIRIEQVIF